MLEHQLTVCLRESYIINFTLYSELINFLLMNCQQRVDLWRGMLSRAAFPAISFSHFLPNWHWNTSLLQKRINKNKSGNQKYWNEWRGMRSHYLEVLRNLWRLLLSWPGAMSQDAMKIVVKITHKESVPWNTGFSEGCSLSSSCLGIFPECLLCLPFVQPRHQHHKGGLSCSLAACMKALQRCQDEFPCARTRFYF